MSVTMWSLRNADAMLKMQKDKERRAESIGSEQASTSGTDVCDGQT